MSPIAVSIIHPGFQNVKKAGRLLHLLAALLIIANAVAYYRSPDANRFYFWSQLIVAIDILILTLAGKDLLNESPRFNLFFRMTEAIVFTTFCILLLAGRDWLAGIIQAGIAFAYFYLFYYERKYSYAERISFQHLGVNIPGFPQDVFIPWVEIEKLETGYQEFRLTTRNNKQYHFPFKRTLSMDELQSVQEYCHYYLK